MDYLSETSPVNLTDNWPSGFNLTKCIPDHPKNFISGYKYLGHLAA